MLKEDTQYASPIATLFYESYNNLEELKERLMADSDKIQCIVGKNHFANQVSFGHTQKPQLWDYADGVDTLLF